VSGSAEPAPPVRAPIDGLRSPWTDEVEDAQVTVNFHNSLVTNFYRQKNEAMGLCFL
jgi:hypothetical protein